MSRTLLVALALLLTPLAAAAETSVAPSTTYRAVSSGDAVQDRLFYLFTLIQAEPKLAAQLDQDPALAALAAERRSRFSRQPDCATTPACFMAAYQWTDADIEAVAKVFKARAGEALWRAKLVAPMRASGYFIRYADRDDGELLALAWRDAANGMNQIIRVYGQGETPRYPAIDSINFDVKSPSFASLVASLHAVTAEVTDPSLAGPSLRFARGLLYVNAREDAGRFSPAEDPENRETARFLKHVNFRKYRYSALLVLGDGPDTPESRLGAFGKLRVMTAVRRWREGLAPVIIVSGGNVHPANTPYNEAIEMRRELMERYGVPAKAILVEPHARHTTTNFRNAARLMHRYGVPFDKDALVVTSESHSLYVEGPAFAERCQKELGYMPFRFVARVSPFDVAFRPLAESLQLDAQDPLDP
ncbi:YdcF family protein [uncultured Caulobacter sp.]|uniref:YdcF family protein n=1 Tax=uncultured Caulobacter sp. TaxID=158749 RepID=UPI002619F2E0|nr:YdcF family protein [uncultured Caulobacter sp.]